MGETALQRAVAMDFVEIVTLHGGNPNDQALGQSGRRPALVRDQREAGKSA